MADAVGAAVEHDELVGEAERRAQRALLGLGAERVQVHAVRDHVELGALDAASCNVVREGTRHGHDRARPPVECELEPLEQPDREAAPNHSQLDENRRP